MYSDSEMSARNILSGLGTPAAGDTIVGTGGQFAIAKPLYFGDSSDGSSTVSGALTWIRDMFYNVLTPIAGAAIATAMWTGYGQHCDFTNAPAGAFVCNGVDGNSPAGVSSAATPTVPAIGRTVGTFNGAVGGPAGGATNGVAGNTNNTSNILLGGMSGAAGAGGNGSSGTGGAAGVLNTNAGVGPVQRMSLRGYYPSGLAGPTTVIGGLNSPGGGSGAGDGTAGGAAGTGAIGGGFVKLIFLKITRSSSNGAAGVVACKGGKGGNGGVGAAGNRGGGGGGGGSGGGGAYFACFTLAGTAHTNFFDFSGGAGGNGGAHTGTGTDGGGGTSGFGGVATVFSLLSATTIISFDATALGGTAPTGATGGASVVAQGNF